MRKTSFVLAAIMAIALNCNAQSSNGCYRGFIDAGYSIGVGDYEFGRFEVNTSHGYQFNPYFFLGAGAGLHFMSSYETKDMDIPLDVRDNQVDIPVFANIRCNFSKKKVSPFVDVKGGIETGSEFNKALGKYKNDFGELYVNMIAAGEAGGLLDSILDRLANYLEKAISLRRKVKAAMTYPTVVLIVAIAVVYGLMVFIIPKFKEMYEGFGGELPALTQLAIAISDFLSKWYGGGLIFASIIVSFTVLKLTYTRSPAGRYKLDQIFLRIPKIGDLIRKVAVAKFSRTFGTLLSSGVSILDALDIVAKTSGNKVIEKALLDSKRDIESGKTIVEPLEKSGVFPSMVIQMISVGEETGSLDLMLQKIADFYDDEVDRAVEGLTKLIEPFLMLFVGGAVGFVIIAMYLPIFKLGDVIQ
ncbi:MAG: type II secretion system F family protein [Geovibrio sp.]|nr:type II secretion system F family protein [Geovibrio sp.]